MAALEITQKCRSCGESHSFSFNGIINVAGNPELRERVASGDYFTWECPCCGARNLVASQTCLYHDAEEKLIIVMAPAGLKMEQLPQGAEAQSMYYCKSVLPAMEAARKDADLLETLTDKTYWPYPTYSDLLFYV